MEIKNIKKVATRLLKAIKSKEKIILYGDADLDGVSAVIILNEAIKSLGGQVSLIYFPDREKEGYGISEVALASLKSMAPALFVAMDCGIGNFKEIKVANKMGFETIIIDHHEILDKLPEASLIVDPKQKGDKYPFKYFATAGLAFKLAEALFKKKIPESLRKSFLELVAMATIADMMPKTDENETMIAEGLSYLESSWRPAIQVLFGLRDFENLDFMQKVYKINSLLNVRDIQDNLPAAFRVLNSSSEQVANGLVDKLLEKDIQRKQRIKTMLGELEKKITKSESGPVIFEGDAGWDVTFLGIIASLVCAKHQKPVFLYKKGEKESQGGIRAPSGFNVVEAMKKYSGILETYGGHPQAAGFRVKNENLEEFKDGLVSYYTKP